MMMGCRFQVQRSKPKYGWPRQALIRTIPGMRLGLPIQRTIPRTGSVQVPSHEAWIGIPPFWVLVSLVFQVVVQARLRSRKPFSLYKSIQDYAGQLIRASHRYDPNAHHRIPLMVEAGKNHHKEEPTASKHVTIMSGGRAITRSRFHL